jgi:hypothetical protein
MGASVADAVLEAVEDMRALKTGLINRVTIHAIDPHGDHKVVAVNGTGGNVYWLRLVAVGGLRRAHAMPGRGNSVALTATFGTAYCSAVALNLRDQPCDVSRHASSQTGTAEAGNGRATK